MKKLISFLFVLVVASAIFASTLDIPVEFHGSYVGDTMGVQVGDADAEYFDMLLSATITDDNIRIVMRYPELGTSSTLDYQEMLRSGVEIVEESAMPGQYVFTYLNSVETMPGVTTEAATDAMLRWHGDSLLFGEVSLGGQLFIVMEFYPV